MYALFVDVSGYKPLPAIGVLRTVSQGSELLSVSDVNAARLACEKNPGGMALLVTNAPHQELFTSIRKYSPRAKTILLTDLNMSEYSEELDGHEAGLLDHVIAHSHSDHWFVNELRVTVQKILKNDIFGIGKYLAAGTAIHRDPVKSSRDRESLNAKVEAFVESFSLPSTLAKMAFGTTEELLMNAIYDAPVRDGKHCFSHLSRTISVDLLPSEESILSYGCDGSMLAISVSDPFGGLKKDKLYEYVRKIIRRDSGDIVDTKAGGAGLGLYKILYNSHALVCNVRAGKQTEVIAMIDLSEHIRGFGKMTRSIHFFECS